MSARHLRPNRCQATCMTHGQQCQNTGTKNREGKFFCGNHQNWLSVEADGDGEHVSMCNDLLVEAMNHERWLDVDARIRNLIMAAQIELGRATGES